LKTKVERIVEVVSEEKSLQELLLNTKLPKYKIVSVIARWTHELKNREEYKHLDFHEILDQATRDILSEKIAVDDILKLPPVIESFTQKKPRRDERNDRSERNEKPKHK